jgi:hypothetical protein
MTQELQQLLAALREELKHYGELLALLEQQRNSVHGSAPDRTFYATSAIQQQAEATLQARRVSEASRRALARELRQDESATVLQLTPLVPPQFRPLLQSLIEENQTLFQSVQWAARENHVLLSRSVASMEEFLDLLFDGEPPVAA